MKNNLWKTLFRPEITRSIFGVKQSKYVHWVLVKQLNDPPLAKLISSTTRVKDAKRIGYRAV
jgi:hypothetical protein